MLPSLSFDLVAKYLAGKAFDQLKGDADAAESRLTRLSTRLGGIGAAMSKIGAGMTAGVTTPLVIMGNAMVERASQAQEAASAFDALFQSNAESVRRWADATAKAMGRSTYELQGQAASFQQLFKAAAPTGEAAAGLSEKFAALTQDLASFYNVTESDALAKLRSGLAGEAEPLRTFGVFLTEAAVKAKAMEMGLGDANGKLTEQEKILARAKLILETTTDAQGDAVRTASSFANQSRALSAAWNDLAVKLGTVLLPLATKFVTALTGLVRWFEQLSPATQEWIVIAGGVAAALGPMLAALGTVTLSIAALLPLLPAIGAGFAALAGPVGLVVAALAAIAVAWAYWDDIKAKFPGFASAVETALAGAQAALQTFWTALLNWNSMLLALFSGDFSQAWAIAKSALLDFGQMGTRVFEAMFPGALDAAKAKMEEWKAALVAMKDAALMILQAMVEGIKSWVEQQLNAVWDSAAAKIQWVSDKFYGLYDAVVGHSYVPDMVKGIGDWMGQLPSMMIAPAQKAAEGTEDAFANVGSSISSVFEGIGSDIAAAIKGTKSWGDVLAGVLQKIGNLVLSQMDFGGMGIFGSLLKGLFGGFFATGGVLASGKVGVVGENGPELISAGASPIRVTPLNDNGRQTANSNYSPTFNIDARGADQAAVARLERSLNEFARTEAKRIDARMDTRQVRKVRA